MTKDLQLTVRRVIAASPERVFAAWTEPKALRKWWGPAGVTCPEAVGGIDPGPPNETVTVRFESSGEHTEVIVHHERIASKAALDEHLRGWRGCLEGLHRLSGRVEPVSCV